MLNLKKIFNSISARTFERTLDFYGLTLRRYKIALSYAKGKKVLDIGSGLGQGPNFLALNGAKKVLGIDYSKKATDSAQEKFELPNLEFKTLSALKITSLKRKFDVVTAFEVIEHLPKGTYCRFLESVSKILAKNGVFLMSTPNKLVTSPGLKTPLIAYHTKEFTPKEILAMTKKYFKKVEIKGVVCLNKEFTRTAKEVMSTPRHKLAVMLKKNKMVCEILAFVPARLKRLLSGEQKIAGVIDKDFDYTKTNLNQRENLLIVAR